MRTETKTVCIGEDVGPVDWDHPTAKDMPQIWREAEKNPAAFTFSEYRRQIISICMYDGWPYWTPRPAICFIGPMHSAEWTFFDSYAVDPGSITRRPSVGASTMNDAPIPEDIRRAAEAVVERGYDEGLIDAVCRALMAERQRCLDLAEIAMKVNLSDRIPAELADHVLEAIRKGSS